MGPWNMRNHQRIRSGTKPGTGAKELANSVAPRVYLNHPKPKESVTNFGIAVLCYVGPLVCYLRIKSVILVGFNM